MSSTTRHIYEVKLSIIENEDFIIKAIEKYRRSGNRGASLKGLERYSKKTFRRLSNLIKKRLTALTLFTNKRDGSIESVTFTFNKSTKVYMENKPIGIEKRVFYEDDFEFDL